MLILDWQFQISPCAMPDPQDEESLRIVVDFVNDSIGGDNQFPQNVLPIFRNDPANSRKGLKGLNFGYQQITETFGHVPVISCDVANEVA